MSLAFRQQIVNDSAKYTSYVYFAVTVLILGVYGERISPYLGEPVAFSILIYLVPFLFVALLKYLFEPIIIDTAAVLKRPRRQFFFDMSLYALVGIIIFTAHSVFYMQPMVVAIKIIVGILIIGYFASIDNALTRERFWFSQSDHETKRNIEFSPLSSKLSLFMTVTVFIGMTLTGLVAFIDLGYINQNAQLDNETMMQVFVVDIFFVFGVILVLTLRLIHSFSLNLQHVFSTQLSVLQNVQTGNLSQYVPIVTQDEFGLLAQQVNLMIDSLRDKEQLRHTLEKIVSPSIMEKLLSTDDKTLKHGQEYQVAILFCDLRDFTRFTENTSAEDLIFFLNAYFSQMAKIVTTHHGIINKFMGDSVLAVYGLEDSEHVAENAVKTALTMLDHARNLSMPDGEQLEIGIGIHTGKVIAGTIGSEERYEYTFIGDAVNTASRLDGLSKRLGYRLIVSEEAYKEMKYDTQCQFVDLGVKVVRGKAEPVHVYGASPHSMMQEAQ